MFKKTCPYCHVTTEAKTIEELGLKRDLENTSINEERRNNMSFYERYEKTLKEYKSKLNKDEEMVSKFNEKHNLKNVISKDRPKIIDYFDNGYSICILKTEIVNEKTYYEPKMPQITMLPEYYIECQVCRHKYRLDGSDERGF